MNKYKNRDKTLHTKKEQEVLSLQEQGLSYSQIGKRLGIATGTVNAHMTSARSRIRAKDYQQQMKERINE